MTVLERSTSVYQLIDDLCQKQVELTEESGQLRYRAPKGVVTKELLEKIASNKINILEVLRRHVKLKEFRLPQIVLDQENLNKPFPLTDVQHAYWIGRSDLFTLGNIASHIYFEIESDTIDIQKFNIAWRRIVERHDMMRAIILPSGEQQILQKVPPYNFDVTDLRGNDEHVVEEELDRIRHELSHKVMPADQWPLFNIKATRLTEKSTRFHFGFDFMVCDATSLFTVFDEWWQIYLRPEIELPMINISFRDYVIAEQSLLDSEPYRQSEAYWKSRLPTMPEGPKLPVVTDFVQLKEARFARWAYELEAERWDYIKKQAAQYGLTPNSVLLAAFSTVLSRWSQESHFTINLTLFNRHPMHPQISRLVGDFTSLTLLSIYPDLENSFVDQAKQIQEQLWRDLDHRYFSGVRVLRELNRIHGDSQRNLMPVVFTSMLGARQEGPDGSPSFIDKTVHIISQTPQVWLDHQVGEKAGKLTFNWDVLTELFPDGVIDEMFTAYCRFLDKLAGVNTNFQESSKNIWTQVGIDIHSTVTPKNPDVEYDFLKETLHGLFLKQVETHADANAIVGSNRTLNYGELYGYSKSIQTVLQRAELGPNKLVGVVMEKGWEQIAGVLGILHASAAYVPIDPSLPQERRFHILESCSIKSVLTQTWIQRRLEWPADVKCYSVDTLDVTELSNPKKDDGLFDGVQNSADLAYVIFTSGSTGQPKGVMINHRSAVNTILDINTRFSVKSDDKVLALSNLNFDLSVYDIFGTLAAGGTIVLPQEDKMKAPDHWLQLMQQEKVTLWNSVPALMQMLIEYVSGSVPEDPIDAYRSLRLVMMSGDWIPLSLPDQIRNYFTTAEIVSLGGATEGSIWSIFFPINSIDPSWPSIPYGKALTNQSVYVLNSSMQLCPTWVTGRLYIGGEGLALGYWQDREKTAASFVTHPVSGERLYNTGDLGKYLPDGNIEFIGREDTQVKIKGYRIELGDVEAAMQAHPDINQSVAIVQASSKEDKHLVGFVLPEQCRVSDLFATEIANEAESQELWQSLMNISEDKTRKSPTPTSEQHSRLQGIVGFYQNLELVYDRCLIQAFRTLGAFAQANEIHNAKSMIHKFDIQPRYEKWLQRGLLHLAKKGLLQPSHAGFECLLALPEQPAEEYLRQTKRQLEEVFGLNDRKSNLFIDTCAHLGDVLQGNIRLEQIYSSDELSDIYEKVFESCNATVKSLVQSLVASLPENENLTILEVGAGLGTTTRHLLPVLPKDRTRFVFTDISRYYLQQAQEDFAEFEFIEYGLLDLEKNTQSQGYDVHSFDLIIASSVFHVTRNIEKSLEHTLSLLAPGGLLMMIEETQFHASFDLILGLQPGFDSFEDEDLRTEHHPLLSSTLWEKILLKKGFDRCAAFNKKNTASDYLGFDVIIARAPSTVVRLRNDHLKQFLRTKLPNYMIPTSFGVLDRIPLTPNGKVDRKTLSQVSHESGNLNKDINYTKPITETESILATIWSEVLQQDKICIHTDFFDLGGDSLLAMKVFNKIQDRFTIELAIQSLYEARTIYELARVIDTDNKSSEWSSLVRIQTKGKRRPFFCIHASDGFVYNYKKFSDFIGDEQPFYGIQARGIDGEFEPFNQIEEMAKYYLKEIENVQKKEPYLIGGWSMGALIAIEMVQQLKAIGKTVASLVLIDPPIPQEWVKVYQQSNQSLLNKMAVLVQAPEKALDFVGLSPEEFQAESPAQQMELFYDGAQFSQQLPQEISFEQFKHVFAVINANLEAICHYQPICFTGGCPVIYFKPESNSKSNQNFERYWRDRLPGDIEVHAIPGDHWSMIVEEDNLRVLSEKFVNYLTKITR